MQKAIFKKASIGLIGLTVLLTLTAVSPLFFPADVSAAGAATACKKSNNPDSCEKAYDQCDDLYKDKRAQIADCKKDVISRFGRIANQCGKGEDAIRTRFNFGCIGNRLPNKFANPVYDFAFSIIRFLSAGVGVAVVIAIILSGIKYTTAEGNPEATMQAKSNMQAALIALIFYIFIFAIVQYLVPGGVFN